MLFEAFLAFSVNQRYQLFLSKGLVFLFKYPVKIIDVGISLEIMYMVAF
jgi:hypothetical protein